ncbi:flagellar hook capping FlgD N-terminal domain-containing protein [Halobacteriovorax sp. XZX-3]|uniref:flagellar hook assembly protein FlgD n=1 Tax=unclassified Halobacteriovorax TaxID=2639665 RepID=UPI000CD1072C|nr:flagellar hook capping FlgD N-terminal domain-containing protein [Halobacteriovorax sp. DA5]POB12950.1 hypothetical protein C0Z22_13835 [Halobacteriovorax sp. DA5]
MPEIGKPQQRNSFSQIGMGPRQTKGNSRGESVGEQLNRIAGNDIVDQKFVDEKEHNKMGQDGFLKLLSHQLTNQDPMKPMDQKQLSADLAQFSQLEQMTNMNAKLDKMGKNDPQELKFFGASFLGKEILTKGASVSYDGQSYKKDVPFFLDKEAKNVMVNIYDKNRQLIGKVEAENLGRGQHTLAWNGRQLDNTRAAKGDYTLEVWAFDKDMNKFKGETKSTGVVNGVDFENGETIFTLENGKKVFLRDVDSFKLASNTGSEVNDKNIAALQKRAAQNYNNINNSANQ